VEDSHVETRVIEYRRRGGDAGATGRGDELVAVALTDVLSDGLSMVYSFFEPSEENRSLGTFMIRRTTSRAPDDRDCLTSISATGSKVRRRWTTGPLPAAAAPCPSGWLRIDATGEVPTEPQVRL